MRYIFAIVGVAVLLGSVMLVNKSRIRREMNSLSADETAVRLGIYSVTRIVPTFTLIALWLIPAMIIITLPSPNGDPSSFYDYCWLFLIPSAGLMLGLVDASDIKDQAGTDFFDGQTTYSKSRKHYLRLAMETPEMQRRVGWWPAPFLKYCLAVSGLQFGKPEKA